MILVTGATGLYGKAAIQHLLKKGVKPEDITALVRDEAKSTDLRELGIGIRVGNYDDIQSLKKAFTGVDKLLFVSGSEVERRTEQHKNVVDAAVHAAVPYLVYTSFYRKSDEEVSPIGVIGQSHIDTENFIRNSGIAYTILQNALYAEILPMFTGEHFLESGIFLPAGSCGVPVAERNEMAEAAAAVITSSGHENKLYRTVNTVNFTFFDIADSLSKLLNTTITYKNPTTESFIAVLQSNGLPQAAIDGILLWVNAIRDGYFESDSSDLELLLGRKPAGLDSMLTKLYSK
ncbi:MAG: NmrA family NAD(P)-binding protein [Ignavibacteriales bacterium]|nr:NmrA family NAD(P)-binding protein [Ignavibacteriales bacterium]